MLDLILDFIIIVIIPQLILYFGIFLICCCKVRIYDE